MIKDSSASEQEAKGFLRFMAITLYELDKMRIPPELIKSVFELHISAMLGFSPDLRACRSCACYEHKEMYCGDCAGSYSEYRKALVRLSPELLYAMRHMLFSPVDKIYRIKVAQDDMKVLSGLTENYLLKQLDRGFRTLDYFYSIRKKTI